MAIALLIILLLMQAVPAAAQQPPDAVATAPIRFGPLGLGPRMALTNVGIDTNVFNDAENPKQDFTLTASPGIELWLRAGPGLLTAEARLDIAYFATYSTETSASRSLSAGYEFPLNRVRPMVNFYSDNVRERPGYEIDTRVRRQEDGGLAGMDVRLAGKSHLQMGYRQSHTTYDEDAAFGGQRLDQSLNRESKAAEAVFRYQLTPMTTWVVRASGEQDRFEFATARNSNTGRISTGFDLGRFALIRGSANVGYRTLRAADGGTTPSFRGLTADVNVSYTAPTQTRLSLMASRDIEYSYDLAHPYYLQTGLALTLTQRIIGHWDVQVLGGRDRLDYRAPSPSDRIDLVDRIGGGVGYQFAERVRFSLDAQAQHRQSVLPLHTHKTFRVGGSVTYGY